MPFLQRAHHRVLPKVALLPSGSCTLCQVWLLLAFTASLWRSRLGHLSNSHHTLRFRVSSEPHAVAYLGRRLVVARVLPLALAPSSPGASYCGGGRNCTKNGVWVWPSSSLVCVLQLALCAEQQGERGGERMTPNPSIEGRPKRLRLSVTPHVKR